MKTRRRLWWRGLTWVYALGIYGFIFLPVVVLVLFSFQAGTLPVWPLQGLSWRWYSAVFTDGRLLEALVNALVVGVGSSLWAVALGFAAAYGLARHPLPGAPWLRGLLVAPLLVSYLIVAMGLLIFFNATGLGKSLWAVAIGHGVINTPLAFALIYSQLGTEEARLERAARDLGAREWQVVVWVVLPLLWPAMLASFALAFTLSWDEFIIAFLLSRFDVTLPVELWSMLRSGLDPRTNAAGSVVFGVSLVMVAVAGLVLWRLGGRRS